MRQVGQPVKIKLSVICKISVLISSLQQCSPYIVVYRQYLSEDYSGIQLFKIQYQTCTEIKTIFKLAFSVHYFGSNMGHPVRIKFTILIMILKTSLLSIIP